MRYCTFILLLLAFYFNTTAQVSIYSFQIDSIGKNGTINFSAFAGRKILLVNTASQDSMAIQYSELKQLALLYPDSLVVIAIPTNSFNTEPDADTLIADFYVQGEGNNFPVASKISVTGDDISPLYQWLTNESENNVMNSKVERAFQKYLIDKTGKLIGIFGADISPMDPVLLDALNPSSN